MSMILPSPQRYAKSVNEGAGEGKMQIFEQVNAASPFNAWAGFELLRAEDGAAELAVDARPELLQHGGFLHAGVIGGLIDTACGFAAASVAGNVLASQYQVMCYAPAVGERFVARAKVTRAGKRQVFATAELFALKDGAEKLVAGGSAVLMVA
jgi:uncharacterized protein (TIGR00369 family)